jgi:hypothetical protein
MTQRLARGSMPWPVQLDGRSACRGSLTIEAPIAPGARLRITAWPRSGPDGELWLSLELTDYPPGGRATRDNPRYRARRIPRIKRSSKMTDTIEIKLVPSLSLRRHPCHVLWRLHRKGNDTRDVGRRRGRTLEGTHSRL